LDLALQSALDSALESALDSEVESAQLESEVELESELESQVESEVGLESDRKLPLGAHHTKCHRNNCTRCRTSRHSPCWRNPSHTLPTACHSC